MKYKNDKDKEYRTRGLYRHHKDSCEVVVFIHGILESPKQFRTLAEIAYREGYSTYRVWLPGHGGDSIYFAQIGYMEWVKYISDQITWLLTKYDQIIIVGHSMGALLGICEAVTRKKRIKALFLINVPLKIHLWPRVIKSALKINFGKVRVFERYTIAEYHAMGVGPIKLRAFIGLIRRYSELLTIISYTKKQVKYLTCKVALVFAAKDEFVNSRSIKYFRESLGDIRVLYLKDSGHFCYHHSDLVAIEENYITFIKEIKTTS